MNLATSNYLPGDPRLIDQIVYELKSQGIFDQFRKECIADVDTKPAYQNLSQRVEGSVMNFLKLQTFSEDINKNQLREQLRKNISESGFLETGVERIVDQVVNPKINTVFLPKVEDVVYRFLGIEKPNQEIKQDVKVEDLLPNDLEAISPESVQDHSLNPAAEKKEENIETNDSMNSSNTKTEEDESPPFELLEENTKFSVNEDNSIDSHLSGISGLASHESSHSTEMKDNSNSLNVTDITQNSINSEGSLSVIVPEEDIKMEISDDSNILECIETKLENNVSIEDNGITENQTNDTEAKVSYDLEEQITEKMENINNEKKSVVEQKTVDKNEIVAKKIEEKKISDSRNNSKKNHDKHKSSRSDKDKKDDSGKRSRSKSDSKSKDSKSSSKQSSSSKDRDKRDSRNGKDKEEVPEKDKQIKREEKERDRSKDKNIKVKEKDRDKSEKDKVGKDKEKSDRERSHKDKERSEKSRSEKDKGKSEKDKVKVDKDKDKEKSEKEKSSSSKHNKEKSSSSSKKDSSSKDKDRDKSVLNKDKISSSGKHKESTTKERDSSKSSKDKSKSSSSNSRDKEKEKKDSKSRSTDKHKKSDKDKSSQHDKNSSKKDKEKKSVDDHYSLKDKKSERRSTDRDSNDGSSKVSRNGSFTDPSSQSFKGSSKESSEVFSSGSGDTSNSDKVENISTAPVIAVENTNAVMQLELEAPIKYFKPKFASNIHEAMKIMKIRKQLAKLERQNQLALVHVQTLNQGDSNNKLDSKESLVRLGKSIQILDKPDGKQRERLKPLEVVPPISKTSTESGTVSDDTKPLAKMEESPLLKSQDLSMESFEALEARLAQEMSNLDYNMYGEEEDEYGSINFSPVKKQKLTHEPKNNLKKTLFGTSEVYTENNGEIELIVPKKSIVDISLQKIEDEKSSLKTENMEVQESTKVPKKSIVDINSQKTEYEKSYLKTENTVVQESNEVTTKLMVTVEPNKDVGCEAKPPDSESIGEHVNNDQETGVAHAASSKPLKKSINDVLTQDELKNKDEESSNNKDISISLYDDSEEFRGFSKVDRDCSGSLKFAQIILEMKKNIGQNINGKINAQTDISKTALIVSPRKRGIPVRPTIKDVKNMSSTLQDLLQKNGKKLLIKVDHIESELPSKTLVSLQDLEANNVNKINIGIWERTTNEECMPEFQLEKQKTFSTKRINQNIPVDEKTDRLVMSAASNRNGIVEQNRSIQKGLVKWENDDSPCYYFDKPSSDSEKYIQILNERIKSLEKAVQVQSLQIQNNIPKVPKRGRKRKAQSTENNNSMSSPEKTESKKRQLSEANQIDGNLCNTDVTPDQNFSLPLSPAESEKSEEQKKEEAITVKPKRSGRVSNSKRYSSDDLYKPRPILSCTSARRRGTKPEDNKH